MFNENKLWRERAGRRGKDLGRYLRYIFNGHLVVVLLFLVGSGAYYYQNWVNHLSSRFPAEILIAVCLGLLITYSPIYTFLLEADQVFLLPIETKLHRYFLRSGVVSFAFEGYILLLAVAVFMPMYAHVSRRGFQDFFPFLIALFIIKMWNLITSWQIQYFVQPSVYFWDIVVRYFMNILFVFLLFKQAHLLILTAITVIMILYFRYFYVRTRNMGLKWDVLIRLEEKRMNSFYRLANLFTDVPNLKDPVRRRKWLDIFLKPVAFSQNQTYLFLLIRTFLRSGDYLGLFVRLSVIGSMALYFFTFGIGQTLLSLLFLYLTGFQLLPLWNHHQQKLWVNLYPVPSKYKSAAFFLLLLIILISQTTIFAFILLIKGAWQTALIELFTGMGFSYFFVYVYSKKRLKI